MIEAEEALVEEFESRKQLGSAALLRAIGARLEADQESDEHEEPAAGLLSELRAAIVSLNDYSRGLEGRHVRLSRFELEQARLRLLRTAILNFQWRRNACKLWLASTRCPKPVAFCNPNSSNVFLTRSIASSAVDTSRYFHAAIH